MPVVILLFYFHKSSTKKVTLCFALTTDDPSMIAFTHFPDYYYYSEPNLSFYVGLFTQNRFVIVVNKMDQVNGEGSAEEEELTREDVINKVYEFVRAKFESDEEIPKSIVVPVSAIRAYNARMFLQDPTSTLFKKAMKKSFMYCVSDQPCGESFEVESGEELAKTLVDHSNIMELEER
jgi:hypothetical protein